MYLRLTSRCNMKCDHCAFSCGSRGTDMTREIFDAALKLSVNYGSIVTLGGGEPTLHPLFWEFLAMTIAEDIDGPPLVVTNGKVTKVAMTLARLAKAGVVCAELSQDPWHDRIDPEVIQAFIKGPNPSHYGGFSDRENMDLRGIRDVSSSVVNIGRAKATGVGWEEHCVCDCIVIDPTGRLWQCGCRRQPFGTVFVPEIPDDYWQLDNPCSRKGRVRKCA